MKKIYLLGNEGLLKKYIRRKKPIVKEYREGKIEKD